MRKAASASDGDTMPEWAGFEDFVARIERAFGDSATVKRGEVFRFGKDRILKPDVTVRTRRGLLEHLTIIECRKRKHKNGSDWMNEIAGRKKELESALGISVAAVAVSSKPLPESALECARTHAIQVRTLEELPRLSDEEVMSLCGLMFRNFVFEVNVCEHLEVEVHIEPSSTPTSKNTTMDVGEHSTPITVQSAEIAEPIELHIFLDQIITSNNIGLSRDWPEAIVQYSVLYDGVNFNVTAAATRYSPQAGIIEATGREVGSPPDENRWTTVKFIPCEEPHTHGGISVGDTEMRIPVCAIHGTSRVILVMKELERSSGATYQVQGAAPYHIHQFQAGEGAPRLIHLSESAANNHVLNIELDPLVENYLRLQQPTRYKIVK